MLLELCYTALMIFSYFFTDATPSSSMKRIAAFIIALLFVVMVLINLCFLIYFICQGRNKIKEDQKL